MSTEEIKQYLDALAKDYSDDVLFYEDEDYTIHECRVSELVAEIIGAIDRREAES